MSIRKIDLFRTLLLIHPCHIEFCSFYHDTSHHGPSNVCDTYLQCNQDYPKAMFRGDVCRSNRQESGLFLKYRMDRFSIE